MTDWADAFERSTTDYFPKGMNNIKRLILITLYLLIYSLAKAQGIPYLKVTDKGIEFMTTSFELGHSLSSRDDNLRVLFQVFNYGEECSYRYNIIVVYSSTESNYIIDDEMSLFLETQNGNTVETHCEYDVVLDNKHYLSFYDRGNGHKEWIPAMSFKTIIKGHRLITKYTYVGKYKLTTEDIALIENNELTELRFQTLSGMVVFDIGHDKAKRFSSFLSSVASMAELNFNPLIWL